MRETLSLDGQWQIAFDHGNVGKSRGWANYNRFVEDSPRHPVLVPACWELFEQDYEGVAWYAREFCVPESWQGKSVRVHFGAVNYLSEVYVNDLPVGFNEGGYTDFSFEIGDVLNYDAPNTLVLRVIGPIITQDKVIDGIGRNDMPHWRGAIAGGIWQSVSLTVSEKQYTSDIFVDPDIQNSQIRIQMSVENIILENRDLNVLVQAIPLGVAAQGFMSDAVPVAEESVALMAAPGQSDLSVVMDIPSPELWSVDCPFLYSLKVTLLAGDDTVDSTNVRFGMREFVIRDKFYYLNGKRILIKSAFFEGLYPTTLAAPPDDDFARRELQLAKDAGFNLLRPWRKPQPPIVYDLADEMGLLFVGTMPIECMNHWPTMTPYTERRLIHEVKESIRRDRNHPSVIMWEIFNEINRPSLQRIKQRVSREARYLDPSRFILDESGGFGGGAFIYPPNSLVPEQINDVHNYPGAPFSQTGYDRMLSLSKTEEQLVEMGIDPSSARVRSEVVPGRFTHVSEIGYGSLPDLEANVEEYERSGNPLTPDYRYHKDMLDHFQRALEFSGLNTVYPSVRDFCMETQAIHASANKLMVEAIRMNPDIAGFAIHAYTDGDWVVGAGLLDLYRNPKQPYYAAKETNQTVYLALRSNRRNLYAGDELTVTAKVASELEETFEAVLSVDVVDQDGAVVWSETRGIVTELGVNAVLKAELDTTLFNGLYSFRGKIVQADKLVTENAYAFRVGKHPGISNLRSEITICDASGKLGSVLDAFGIQYRAFDEAIDVGTTVLVNANDPGLDSMQSEMLIAFVKRGGTVLYLDMPRGESIGPWSGNFKLEKDWLPVNLCMAWTQGMWTPYMHVIRDHRISEGLPSNKAMDADYVNVYPVHSIAYITDGDPEVPFVGMDLWSWLGEDAKRAPCATLGLGWRLGAFTEDRDYRGPGPVTYGADLLDVPFGDGTVVFSTLRLIDQLGKDPVADKLFMNILDWVMSL